MQPISIYNYSFVNRNNKSQNKISFSGESKAIDAVDNIVAPKTIKLVKQADEFIETTWAEIRSKKNKAKVINPEFRIREKDSEILFKPLYNTAKPTIMLEKRGVKYIDRIIIERQNPNHFRYEKSMLTPTGGSATIKIYDSLQSNNPEIVDKVNDYIEKYIPKILNSKKKLF